LVDTYLVLWARIAPERLTTGERRQKRPLDIA
jgi:hypothetical protein